MLVTVFVGTTAAFLAWRERPEPGAVPLVALLAGQCWWSVFFIFELQARTLAGKILWSDVQWIGVVVIPVAWLAFALEYTGHDRYVTPKWLAALAVVPILTVVFAATDSYHSILYLDSTLVTEGGFSILQRTPGVWFWVIAGYTYLLGLLGSIPILRFIRSDALAFRGQSAALLIGTVAPWASNALFLVGGSPLPGLDPTPVAFAVSGVAYLGALTRFRLLGTSPSPNHRARRIVFERMHERAVVVDNHDYVVDLNQTAAAALGTAPRDAIGQPAASIIPAYDTLPADGPAEGAVTLPADDNLYDVTATRITDSRGRTIGRVITFHDISDYLRQQQRLEVLNRVFRHNIRNETNVIYGYADLVADADGEHEANIIKDRALSIDEMSRKARDILDVFENARRPVTAVPLVALLDQSITAVTDDYPGVPIACGSVPGVTVSNVLAPVFSNAIENAAEHNTFPDPWVRIDVERDDDVVRVVVRDNGPTIDPYERSVLERGTETPLEHGSGLGLWLIAWGTQIADGTVTFSENDPTGSVVTVEAPILGESTGSARRRLEGPEGAADTGADTDTEFDSPTDTTTSP